MGSAKTFEELQIWQEARRLVREIYFHTNHIKDLGFNDQIQRAAVSIMNNIAERFEAGSSVMFKKFLYISKGSCGEVKSMLYIAEDLHYIPQANTQTLIKDCQGLSFAINKFIQYLKNHPKTQ